MKQKNHYSEARAYLRDYSLRHGRLMHFSHGDIFEAEGAAARLFGYIESGSFHYLVRNYEGGESTVETVAAGDLVGCYPYYLDGDPAPVTIRADKSCTVRLVDGQHSTSVSFRARRPPKWRFSSSTTASPSSISSVASIISPIK